MIDLQELDWLPPDATPLEDAITEEMDAVMQELARRTLWDCLRYWFMKRQVRLVESWYLRYACEIGEAIVACVPDFKDTIINMPPRSLKSELFTMLMPAWAIGRDYTSNSSCMNLSYSGALALTHSGKSLAIVKSAWYRATFQHVILDPKKQSVAEWAVVDQKTGILVAERSAAGVEGDPTGRGGNLLIADDLLKPREANSEVMRKRANDFMGETLVSRRNDALRARRLVVAQRLHEDDPCGKLLSEAKAGGTPWKHICIANEAEKRTIYSLGEFFYERAPGELMCPERIDRKTTEQMKKEMGPNYSGQMNQIPVKLEGSHLKPKLLQRFEKSPELVVRENGLRTVMFIDYAGSSEESLKDDPDEQAISIFAKDHTGRMWWLESWAEQCGPEDVAAAIIELNIKWRCVRRFTEKGALKNVLGSVIRNECQRRHIDMVLIEGVYVPGDIVERMEPSRSSLFLGMVWVPKAAIWLSKVEEQMRTFPLGKKDDRLQTLALAGHVLPTLPLPRFEEQKRKETPPGVITGQDLLDDHARLERAGKVPRLRR